MNGVLVVDKPAGMTSHDVVASVRRLANERSVGHLGTLDPDATGVLPLLLGRLTRLAQFYLGSEKQYEGEIRLGFATDTYDASGEALGPPAPVNVTLEQVRAAAERFRGEIEQMPPPFSAKKIAGVPAYKLARSKKEVKLEPARVTVHGLEIENISGDRLRFRARVSAGTYLRSLAHDLGIALGTGAHLGSLRRTAVAEFTLDDARTLDEMAAAATSGTFAEKVIHPRRILPHMPSVSATEESAGMICHGRAVNLPEMSSAPLVKVFRGQQELIAVASRIAGTLFQPKIVLIGG
jgi:tRNA pseudouridine55 synthase